MELLTPSQKDFLQGMAPPPRQECSDALLSRHNIWRHNISLPPRPQERVRFLLSSSAAVFREWIQASVQEPEAEAWNCLLWQSHESTAADDDAASVVPSQSGDRLQERERFAAYLALSPEQKAALCGWDSSNTAITRLNGFVDQTAVASEPTSWRKRLRDVEAGLAALQGRMDVVEERTGTVIGEDSRNCHAFRLRRLEVSCGLAPSGS